MAPEFETGALPYAPESDPDLGARTGFLHRCPVLHCVDHGHFRPGGRGTVATEEAKRHRRSKRALHDLP